MKILKNIAVVILFFGVVFAIGYFIRTNAKSLVEYETKTPQILSIENKIVVTGKVIPEDEVEIKPQISGIIEKLFVEEGDLVSNGNLLAKVKVVPNEQSLNSAKGRLSNAKLVLRNAEVEYDRNKQLFDKEIISRSTNWDSTRITLMDKLILRLVMSEIIFVEHVPPKVSIAEGIEIAKVMSTDDSGAFVNGILDSFFNDWSNKKIKIKV